MVVMEAATSNPRILVVDDNDDNRYTLTLYLELEGYTDLTIAEDGEQAIAKLRAQDFDLVLLDVMMPKVDGYQVLTWLKGQHRLNDLPVIMISALNEMNSVVRCIELGAVDYLQKPFNQHLLRARLGASLDKKRLRDQVNAHLARLQQELQAAHELQISMLPQEFPEPTAQCPVDVHGFIQPAREVGGDHYDVRRRTNEFRSRDFHPVNFAGVPAIIDADIAAASPAQRLQHLLEGDSAGLALVVGLRIDRHHHRDPLALFRPRGQRKGRRCAKQANEIASSHSHSLKHR
jgi:CheY-like chemotaxis protein